MSKQLIKSSLIWGFVLWFVGYVLGIALFMVVPAKLLGWVIMPLGVLLTLWVLNKKLSFHSKEEAIFIGTVWALIAIICDYLFLVKVFNPADGYYKLDVYLYYAVTFILPLVVGRIKNHK